MQTGAPNAPIMTGRLWFLLSPAIKLLPAFRNTAESFLCMPVSSPWFLLWSCVSGGLITLAMPNLFSLSTRFIFIWPTTSGELREGFRPYISCKNVSAGREARKFSEWCPRGSNGGGEGQGECEGEFGGVEGMGRVRGGCSKGSFSNMGLS